MWISLTLWFSILQPSGWEVLSNVTFESRYVAEFNQEIDSPVFGNQLISLEGNRITLSGYYIPAELTEQDGIILSKQPNASCFFCGGAGIESVVEVQFKEEPRHFKIDEIVTVSGTLQLNADNFDHLIFILNDAQEIR